MTIEVPVAELPSWVGKEIGPGEWHEITQERVNTFAEATGDHQWIHLDVEKAKDGPFGGTIAHGYLTLSLVPMLNWELWTYTGVAMGVNYGSDKVRFLTPVRVGSRVRARTTVLSADLRPDGSYLVKNQVTIEVEGSDKPALVAETLSLAVPA
ncbi:MAG: dehydratase [Frankiales bacterium]|nr:dehydratase [Frankiales bacterium]